MENKNIIAFPPGVTIKEMLTDMDMSQKEFATRMEMSEKHISNLLSGNSQLTHETALKLENVIGMPAKFWNSLECVYREKIKRIEYEASVGEDESIARKIPYAQMASLNWVPKKTKSVDKVIELRKFFKVATLKNICELNCLGVSYRVKTQDTANNYALAAWIQQAKNESARIETAVLDREKLIESIMLIREMTLQEPKEFVFNLKEILSECGITLVFLPHIRGTGAHGATFYKNSKRNKVIMVLSVRGRSADKFWFSLFHEIGHIVNGDINNEYNIETAEQLDKNADNYARDILISKEDYKYFLENYSISEATVKHFSNKIGVHPGIVVGRLQNDKIIDYSVLNHLKENYNIN